MANPQGPLNPSWTDYPPAALASCQRVLGTLVKRLGAQHAPHLVVVGGLVPNLLLRRTAPDPLIDPAPHPGTNDVDLCVQLDLPDDDADLYQGLERVLNEGGFIRSERNDGRGQSVWQWQKTVDGLVVAVEFLAPFDGVTTHNGTAAVGRLATGEHTRPDDKIGALRIKGAALAHRDAIPTTLEIELLDGGGLATVTVWVANVLPFIVLKSFAVRGREKDKDAFDLVWLLTHWPDGPVGAARVARQSAVADDPDVEEALALLRADFQSIRHEGCVRYARFELGEGPASDDRTLRSRFAHGTIAEFLRAWDAAASTRPVAGS